jgi:hypothetical protein
VGSRVEPQTCRKAPDHLSEVEALKRNGAGHSGSDEGLKRKSRLSPAKPLIAYPKAQRPFITRLKVKASHAMLGRSLTREVAALLGGAALAVVLARRGLPEHQHA